MMLSTIVFGAFLTIFSTVTGTADDSIGCYVTGECLGALYVEFDIAEAPVDCHELCIGTDGCNFWTHYAEEEPEPLCFAFVDCPDFGTNCQGCTSGEIGCDLEEEVSSAVDSPSQCTLYTTHSYFILEKAPINVHFAVSV